MIASYTPTFFRSRTDQEVDGFLQKHGEAVAFAHTVLPRGKMAQASIRATLARAAIVKGKIARLQSFGQVLMTGVMQPGDEAAVLLRNHVLEQATRTGRDRRNLYALTQTVLVNFIDGKQGKLVEAKGELFPLPDEDDWRREPDIG